MPVPIVILVCGGDIETIIHISKALKNNTPVIIMKGSGMAADLVADFIKNQYSLRLICKCLKLSKLIGIDV